MATLTPSALEKDLMTRTKEAMKAKDTITRDALRSISGEIKQLKVDNQVETLSTDEELSILKRMIKQRNDSIQQYTEGGREDLADKEKGEIAIIEQFLPKQLSEAEITTEVEKAITATGAESAKDMGKVMGALGHIKATADMGTVSKIVKAKLN